MISSSVIFLIFVCGLSAAEIRWERQVIPEQFSQYTNKLQETFHGANSPFQPGQIQPGFGIPQLPQISKRKSDDEQFEKILAEFQKLLEGYKSPHKRSFDEKQFQEIMKQLQQMFEDNMAEMKVGNKRDLTLSNLSQ